MNKSAHSIFILLGLLIITFNICGQTSDHWHYPLYLSNMGYWHSRIPIAVKNASTQDVYGEPLGFITGKGEGQLQLSGINASGIRVTDSDGTELLWRITSPEGRLVTDGSVPDNSRFTLPATIKKGQSSTL